VDQQPSSSQHTVIGEVFIRRLNLIGHLSDADCRALRSLTGHVRSVARGEDLFRLGDQPGDVVVVLSGLLQRYTLSAEGRRQIHSVYMPGDIPSVESLHIDRMDNNLGALAPSHIAQVPHSELHRVMSACPNVLALIWRETLVQGAIFREWLMRNSQMLAHAQMAHFFCEMITRAKAAGVAEGNSCALPMTQDDLADVLGLTPVHVNRTLMVLRASDAVEFQGSTLQVRDPAKLAELAGFDPAYLHLRSASQQPESGSFLLAERQP